MLNVQRESDRKGRRHASGQAVVCAAGLAEMVYICPVRIPAGLYFPVALWRPALRTVTLGQRESSSKHRPVECKGIVCLRALVCLPL